MVHARERRLTQSRLIITIIIIAAVVLVGALVISVLPASAPPAPAIIPTLAGGGPLFPDMASATIASLAVEDLATGLRVSYLRNSTGVWTLVDDPSGYVIDSAAMERNATAFAGLVANDRFMSDALPDYGLEAPAYLVLVQMADGSMAELYVGGTNEAGDRRYVVAAMHPPPGEDAPTAEFTPEPDSYILTGEQAVSTVVASLIDNWITMFNTPTYIPTPLPTLMPDFDATPEATEEG
jgi:hypothetical protein